MTATVNGTIQPLILHALRTQHPVPLRKQLEPQLAEALDKQDFDFINSVYEALSSRQYDDRADFTFNLSLGGLLSRLFAKAYAKEGAVITDLLSEAIGAPCETQIFATFAQMPQLLEIYPACPDDVKAKLLPHIDLEQLIANGSRTAGQLFGKMGSTTSTPLSYPFQLGLIDEGHVEPVDDWLFLCNLAKMHCYDDASSGRRRDDIVRQIVKRKLVDSIPQHRFASIARDLPKLTSHEAGELFARLVADPTVVTPGTFTVDFQIGMLRTIADATSPLLKLTHPRLQLRFLAGAGPDYMRCWQGDRLAELIPHLTDNQYVTRDHWVSACGDLDDNQRWELVFVAPANTNLAASDEEVVAEWDRLCTTKCTNLKQLQHLAAHGAVTSWQRPADYLESSCCGEYLAKRYVEGKEALPLMKRFFSEPFLKGAGPVLVRAAKECLVHAHEELGKCLLVKDVDPTNQAHLPIVHFYLADLSKQQLKGARQAFVSGELTLSLTDQIALLNRTQAEDVVAKVAKEIRATAEPLPEQAIFDLLRKWGSTPQAKTVYLAASKSASFDEAGEFAHFKPAPLEKKEKGTPVVRHTTAWSSFIKKPTQHCLRQAFSSKEPFPSDKVAAFATALQRQFTSCTPTVGDVEKLLPHISHGAFKKPMQIVLEAYLASEPTPNLVAVGNLIAQIDASWLTTRYFDLKNSAAPDRLKRIKQILSIDSPPLWLKKMVLEGFRISASLESTLLTPKYKKQFELVVLGFVKWADTLEPTAVTPGIETSFLKMTQLLWKTEGAPQANRPPKPLAVKFSDATLKQLISSHLSCMRENFAAQLKDEVTFYATLRNHECAAKQKWVECNTLVSQLATLFEVYQAHPKLRTNLTTVKQLMVCSHTLEVPNEEAHLETWLGALNTCARQWDVADGSYQVQAFTLLHMEFERSAVKERGTSSAQFKALCGQILSKESEIRIRFVSELIARFDWEEGVSQLIKALKKWKGQTPILLGVLANSSEEEKRPHVGQIIASLCQDDVERYLEALSFSGDWLGYDLTHQLLERAYAVSATGSVMRARCLGCMAALEMANHKEAWVVSDPSDHRLQSAGAQAVLSAMMNNPPSELPQGVDAARFIAFVLEIVRTQGNKAHETLKIADIYQTIDKLIEVDWVVEFAQAADPQSFIGRMWKTVAIWATAVTAPEDFEEALKGYLPLARNVRGATGYRDGRDLLLAQSCLLLGYAKLPATKQTQFARWLVDEFNRELNSSLAPIQLEIWRMLFELMAPATAKLQKQTLQPLWRAMVNSDRFSIAERSSIFEPWLEILLDSKGSAAKREMGSLLYTTHSKFCTQGEQYWLTKIAAAYGASKAIIENGATDH